MKLGDIMNEKNVYSFYVKNNNLRNFFIGLGLIIMTVVAALCFCYFVLS